MMENLNFSFFCWVLVMLYVISSLIYIFFVKNHPTKVKPKYITKVRPSNLTYVKNDGSGNSTDSSSSTNFSHLVNSVDPDIQNQIINKFLSNHQKPVKTPYLIGIYGGSGSGKTFIASIIAKTIGEIYRLTDHQDIVIINQDSYYLGGDSTTNYDVPESIDFNLLTKHLEKLLAGEPIKCPLYDFSTHSRKDESKIVHPGKIIIVEGILIMTQEKLRNLFDMKIFVNADEPTQIFRRVIRDTQERKRSMEEVRERYCRDVWPSYRNFVTPSAIYADMSINNTNNCYVGLEIMLNHIITILANHKIRYQ